MKTRSHGRADLEPRATGGRLQSGEKTPPARTQALRALDVPATRPEQILALQRTIGNAAVATLVARARPSRGAAGPDVDSTMPTIQRKISFDGGTTTERSIPNDILGQATRAGPLVLLLLRKWFSENLITTAKDWAEVLGNAKSLAPTTAIDWGNPKDFDSDDSDSDSETENKSRDITMFGSSKATYSSDVFNYTKREGRRKVKGQFKTKRDTSGRRMKPRTDNRVYSAAQAKGLAADATTIHDLIPKHVVDRKTGAAKANQSYGATTVVCAVFRRADGQLRKICSSNADGPMAKDLRAKAEELGYHVVRAEQAHAEGEMLQYLNQREQIYSLYGMGCDKDHCKECNWAMTRTLGDYPTETAKSDKSFKNYYIPPSYARVLGQDYTFDNSAAAMKRHKKEPPKKKQKLDATGTSKPTT